MKKIVPVENHLLNNLLEEVILSMMMEKNGGSLDSHDLEMYKQIVKENESSTNLQD